MTTKLCNTCNETYPIEEFQRIGKTTSFNNNGKTYLKGDCKSCLATKAREWRKQNKNYKGTGKINKIPKEDRLLLSAISTRINGCKNNSRRRNKQIEFSITREQMYSLFKKQEGKCALSGVKLEIAKDTPLTLSIDKIDPNKGYVLENVQWVAWAVNRAKGDLSHDDFLSMCRSVIRTCND